jgi:F0F1-type ATP synthase assembly protein I
MSNQKWISDIPFEAILTFRNFVKAGQLIRKQQLWKGFWQYGWVTKFLMLVLILAGVKFLMSISTLIQSSFLGDTVDAVAIGESLGERLENILGGLFFSGSWKYVLLILAEVLVFHLMRRTIELIGGGDQDDSFSAFLDAQKRMIKIAFYSWVMELVCTILIGIGLGILGLEVLKSPLGFLVQAYFLGFALTDNYFERYGISITESQKLNLQIIGVSLGLGSILYLLFLVPLIGPVLGTSIGAVAAGITLHQLELKQHFVLPEVIQQPKEK